MAKSGKKTGWQGEKAKGKCATQGGVIHWQGDDGAPMTSMGYLPFFSEFLSAGGLFSAWIDDCPLSYSSNNAPKVSDVLATATLAVLAGHTRYQHATSLSGEQELAFILGADKIVSHDSLGRGVGKIDGDEGAAWMERHLRKVYEPILRESYVLDIDPTVKPIYGSQEGAAIGYNPAKPGRPSLCYHTYIIGSARLVVNVDVQPGNQTAGCYSHPGLWNFLDSLPSESRPYCVRGDIAFGNEGTMSGCEKRKVPYLFKLRQSAKVKELLETLCQPSLIWNEDGHGWSYFDTELQLSGWSRKRRIVVLRRQVDGKKKPSSTKELPAGEWEQPEFSLAVPVEEDVNYEWRILVTSLDLDASALGQLYRDRADCENVIDELKNQWGWCGFTSKRLSSTKIMALIIALVYNWWNVFCRLAKPEAHMEATSSRPGMEIIGRLVSSGRGKKLRLHAGGSAARKAMEMLMDINSFISSVLSTATRLSAEHRWATILSRAFKVFLKGKRLKALSEGGQFLLLPA